MDKLSVNGRSQEKSKKKQRVHSLTGRIDDRVMQAAFKAVRLQREAMKRGSPGTGKLHAGKYEEVTSSRQQEGSGWNILQPLLYPLV